VSPINDDDLIANNKVVMVSPLRVYPNKRIRHVHHPNPARDGCANGKGEVYTIDAGDVLAIQHSFLDFGAILIF